MKSFLQYTVLVNATTFINLKDTRFRCRESRTICNCINCNLLPCTLTCRLEIWLKTQATGIVMELNITIGIFYLLLPMFSLRWQIMVLSPQG